MVSSLSRTKLVDQAFLSDSFNNAVLEKDLQCSLSRAGQDSDGPSELTERQPNRRG